MGRFGEFLMRRSRIQPEHLKKAMEFQHMVGGRLGTNLLELGLLREQTLREELGRFLNVTTATAVSLKNIPPEIIRLVPPKIARRYNIVPVQRKDNVLMVASTDPGDHLVEDELSMLTTYRIETVVGLELRVYGALEKYYGVPLSPRLSGLLRRLDNVAAAVPEPPPPAKAPTAVVSAPSAPLSPAAVPEPPPPAPALPAPAEPAPAAPPPPAPPPPKSAGSAPMRPVASAVPAPPAGAVAPPAPPLPGASPSVVPTHKAVEPELQYIEIDEDTRAGLYSEEDEERPPPARLRTAAEVLQNIDIRDEIGDVILDFCRPYFGRRLLLIHRKKRIVGWRGEGEGVEFQSLRAIDIPAEEPSVFSSLLQGTSFWRGLLPELPANQLLIDGLGGQTPKECLVLPISLRSRIVCFVYGDNAERDLGDVPLNELRRLVTKAGVAFEVYILKNKIRTL